MRFFTIITFLFPLTFQSNCLACEEEKEPDILQPAKQNAGLAETSSSSELSSEKIDFSKHLPASRVEPLDPHSPQERLRDSYEQMRQKLTFKELNEFSKIFDKYIFKVIDKNKPLDQTQYLIEIESLRRNLLNTPPILDSYFSGFIEEIDFRIQLARIDQQIFDQSGIRGSFEHPNISINAKKSLSRLIGKIFHITQARGRKPKAAGVGSGILASLDSNNKPLNIKKGDIINGLITAAHVLETSKNVHLIGAYFILNKFLNPETGLPNEDLVSGKSTRGLVKYLQTSSNSFLIDSYAIKKVILVSNNDPTLVNPRYWHNEDIIFAKINNPHLYKHKAIIDFEAIRDSKKLDFFENQRYFAIGYPICDHYDKRTLSHETNYLLIRKIGIMPLVITTSLAHDTDDRWDQVPSYGEEIMV